MNIISATLVKKYRMCTKWNSQISLELSFLKFPSFCLQNLSPRRAIVPVTAKKCYCKKPELRCWTIIEDECLHECVCVKNKLKVSFSLLMLCLPFIFSFQTAVLWTHRFSVIITTSHVHLWFSCTCMCLSTRLSCVWSCEALWSLSHLWIWKQHRSELLFSWTEVLSVGVNAACASEPF